MTEDAMVLYKASMEEHVAMNKFNLWIEYKLREKYDLPKLEGFQKFLVQFHFKEKTEKLVWCMYTFRLFLNFICTLLSIRERHSKSHRITCLRASGQCRECRGETLWKTEWETAAVPVRAASRPLEWMETMDRGWQSISLQRTARDRRATGQKRAFRPMWSTNPAALWCESLFWIMCLYVNESALPDIGEHWKARCAMSFYFTYILCWGCDVSTFFTPRRLVVICAISVWVWIWSETELPSRRRVGFLHDVCLVLCFIMG